MSLVYGIGSLLYAYQKNPNSFCYFTQTDSQFNVLGKANCVDRIINFKRSEFKPTSPGRPPRMAHFTSYRMIPDCNLGKTLNRLKMYSGAANVLLQKATVKTSVLDYSIRSRP